MDEVLKEVLSAISEGETAALVTPVATAGSLPTGRNARMLVRADGSSVGTVGGGRMEAEVQQVAGEVIRELLPRLIHFSLTAQDALEDGLLCGGEASFYVEPVLPGTARETFQEILRLVKEKTPGLEAVRLSEAGPVQRLVVGKDSPSVGTLGSKALDREISERVVEAAQEDLSETVEVGTDGEQASVFLNVLLPRPTVYIFGGGHVGLAVARIAPTAGFRVVVIDDRPEFASRTRFPNADGVRVVNFERALEGLPVDDLSYLVVMTRGHRWDREVVVQALRTDAAYIGMIGSRRKVALTFEALKQEGFSETDLNRVHAPIGLNIGGDTPGEIAISVVGELVRVRRLGEPERLQGVKAEKGKRVPWDLILIGCR